MFDSVINYLDKFGDEWLVIQSGFLVILSTLFLWLWFSNRRKYHNLKHAIPANVVKSYLDSIIQNSTSLKSQLFRGGGLDLGNVPSVMPLHNLVGGDGLAVSGAPSTALLEELNQKRAQIAALESQLSTSQNAQREVESKLLSSQNNLTGAQTKIKELEALLAQVRAGGGGGGDEALKSELTMVTKERDEIRDRLKEFEIISDDLANLKRLQQENDQLKRSLSAQGIPLPSMPGSQGRAEEATPKADVSDLLSDLGQSQNEEVENKALEEFLSPPEIEEPAQDTTEAEAVAEIPEPEPEVAPIAEPEAPSGAEQVAANATPESAAEEKPKSEKSPEDLLSEFEKMLG